MIANAQALGEAKGPAEPVNRLTHVRVGQLGNDRAGRHRAVHDATLPAALLPDG